MANWVSQCHSDVDLVKSSRLVALIVVSIAMLSACQTSPRVGTALTPRVELPSTMAPTETQRKPRIALVLSGGAAKGFAHVGVIKALEAQGILPDIIVGTSVGSVVGALYASGIDGQQLENLARQIEESQLTDWSLPNRGVIKGVALQDFIDQAVHEQPLEKLKLPLAIVATDLQSGDPVVFRSGDTGMAARASSAVPGVFQPVVINGHEYVDGGLVSPVPIDVARSLGADFIIAVDVSKNPVDSKTGSTVEVMLQTFVIMGQTIRRYELVGADEVIMPNTREIGAIGFQDRNAAIQEGEKAVAAVLPELRAKLEKLRIRYSGMYPAPVSH